MSWPYHFLDLTSDEKHLRRQALDRYATIAQLSALAPLALALLARLAIWAAVALRARIAAVRAGGSIIGAGGGPAYEIIPDSPVLKVRRQSARGVWGARLRRARWWLGGDVVILGQDWGRRDQWVFGCGWAAWLLALCVLGTGNDYLHLTKRFGIVAASQFPVQYLLALKSLNPFAYAFRSSHEQANRWHRVLGRIIYALLMLHVILYTSYFVQRGVLLSRLGSRVVLMGLLAFTGLNALGTTATQVVRRWSYRVFFIVHLIVAFAMPVALFFHVRQTRVYMSQALLVFVADLASRKIGTTTAEVALAVIPGTNLIRITAPMPPKQLGHFRDHPASHVYVNVPPESRQPPSAVFNYLYNPFTVAAVDDETGELTLVARHRGGPMTAALARFATRERSQATTPLCFEGPYGLSKYFPRFTPREFDRVLLVAGGIGATFIIPLYRSIVRDSAGASSTLKVELVWAVRSAAEATWAVSQAEGGSKKTILDDDCVQIFVTGGMAAAAAADGDAAPGGVEMDTLGPNGGGDRRRERLMADHDRRRPNLRKIVDDVFRHGSEERVAVLMCGPDVMAKGLRSLVGAWVEKGRSVWWHNESFGW